MRRVLETPFHFLVVVLGLYLLSGIGSLLAYDTELLINLAAYGDRLQQTWIEILHPSSIYIYWGEGNKQYSITEVFSNTYSYSFLILISSFFLAICLAVLFSYSLMLLPRKAYRFSIKIVNVLDALPDVFIVVLFQLFIIWLFKRTNLLVFDIYALGEERIYFLPILCLSVLPVVFLLKQFLFQLKEEEGKPYVEFSYSKGFRKSYTVWHHLFRNVWVHFFFHLKPIFLLMLSNLLIIELLFNINGFMQTLLRTATSSPAAFFLGMLLIFVPFFIVFTIGSHILEKWLKGGEKDE
ncbi:ABC transporter permease subunit [Rossellomorea arthrocnemi]|jgi:ABC-type dipeptide/oligopeptide/nickel transport system permease component|uniref:ABC transporter permease subunit n=1 Tax=Rossellomorea arthrocnemi TaxID=2769542 RepID=UPI00191915EA|nr:ABC transporter permease subunit [Rossellomorea arthrocnemi]